MNILIFSHQVAGHHIEYMHHLYEEAQNRQGNSFFFLTSKEYVLNKDIYKWERSTNTKFIFLTDEEQRQADSKNQLEAAWFMSKILRRYTIKYQIDHVFLLWFIGLMPFLPFFLKKRISISGILYRIYLYKENELSWSRLFLERIRFWIISHSNKIKAVCVLNDENGASELNKRFVTGKFIYLPDPLPIIDKKHLKNIRKELNIDVSNTIYLHFGALEERKGTLEILKAINNSDSKSLQNKAFVFAGRVGKDIRDEFYETVKSVEKKATIKVIDRFCENELLFNLCYSCNCILIPYFNTIQSSGVLGYAAFFCKPVIGPNQDLLGRLIESNELGITLSDVTAQGLERALREPLPEIKSNYILTHRIEEFNNVIFKQII